MTAGHANHRLLRRAPLVIPLEEFLRSSQHPMRTEEMISSSAGSGAARASVLAPSSGLMDESFCFSVNAGEDEVGRLKEGKRINGRSSPSTSSLGRNGSVVKGQWSAEEDSMLIRLNVQLISPSQAFMQKDIWTEEEERMLVDAHMEIGNKWAEIAKRIPGRTENSIKNHWNATKRKQISKRNLRRKAPHVEGMTTTISQKLSVLQNYIKRFTHKEEDASTAVAASSSSHSSPSNGSQEAVLVEPLDDAVLLLPSNNDTEIATEMVEELLLTEEPAILTSGFYDIAQFLIVDENLCYSYGGGRRSPHAMDVFISNILGGPPVTAMDEEWELSGDKEEGEVDLGSSVRCGEGDMDLMEMLNWHLSGSQRRN
ncbi:Transcription factor MYB98 [Apostasia shenzhenica]|uniref:Transcription factor MYB98 n=1 Tax=Apostasia shenzhenica TaxID=1088818 RepID=A0A2I0A905_9ASPA|nr:Transcription factor MYB98 [Apostasia shenzhenica]